MEDAVADAGRPCARHLRRRAARIGRPERRGDPVAPHFHDGPDVGNRDAFVHLLGRAVRRGDHVDPVQHSRRGMVGGDHLRRLPDGPARQGCGSAHRGIHIIVLGLAGRCTADHLSCAGHCVLRVALWAAGILCRVFTDVLLVRRPRPRRKAQDRHLDGARPLAGGDRHGHGLRAVAHDVPWSPSSASSGSARSC